MENYAALKGKEILPYYNVDETWGHYAKWNKPVTKQQILYDSTHTKHLK